MSIERARGRGFAGITHPEWYGLLQLRIQIKYVLLPAIYFPIACQATRLLQGQQNRYTLLSKDQS